MEKSIDLRPYRTILILAVLAALAFIYIVSEIGLFPSPSSIGYIQARIICMGCNSTYDTNGFCEQVSQAFEGDGVRLAECNATEYGQVNLCGLIYCDEKRTYDEAKNNVVPKFGCELLAYKVDRTVEGKFINVTRARWGETSQIWSSDPM